MKEQNNCAGHINICKAECCNRFMFTLSNFDVNLLVKGSIIKLIKPCGDDLALYYKLHGVRYVRSILTIKLDEFYIKDNQVVIIRKCDGLTKDLKCKFHGTDRQPKICAYPNAREHKDLRNICITDNCMYRFK